MTLYGGLGPSWHHFFVVVPSGQNDLQRINPPVDINSMIMLSATYVSHCPEILLIIEII